MSKTHCDSCGFSIEQYDLLFKKSGLSCPKCGEGVKHPSDSWINVDSILPEYSGLFKVKSMMGENVSRFCINKKYWKIEDDLKITHWKY